MADDRRAFQEACYYEACRADDLLAAFAETMLWDQWQQGRLAIGVADVLEWLTSLERSKLAPKWSESVRTRVAQGLLSTARDFGLLNQHSEGSAQRVRYAGVVAAGFRLHGLARTRAGGFVVEAGDRRCMATVVA